MLAAFREGNKVTKAVCIDRFAFQDLVKVTHAHMME